MCLIYSMETHKHIRNIELPIFQARSSSNGDLACALKCSKLPSDTESLAS